MMQWRLAAAAVSLAMAIQPALAQTPPASPEQQGPTGPAATPPGVAPAPGGTTTTTTPPPAGGAASTAPKQTTANTAGDMFYAHQPGEVRASRLIGTRVRNAGGESIGDINDVVLGSDGQVRAVIVGVGGFLGLGEREVAVSMDALQLQAGQSGASTVTVDVMRETLKDAPRWTWAGETSATGSSGGGTGTAPGGTPRTTPKAE